MDESGIEPETSPMLRERATDYATRPINRWKGRIEKNNEVNLMKYQKDILNVTFTQLSSGQEGEKEKKALLLDYCFR